MYRVGRAGGRYSTLRCTNGFSLSSQASGPLDHGPVGLGGRRRTTGTICPIRGMSRPLMRAMSESTVFSAATLFLRCFGNTSYTFGSLAGVVHPDLDHVRHVVLSVVDEDPGGCRREVAIT